MSAQYPQLRHNLFAFGIDAIMFGIAVKFIDPIIVLPAFVTQLGASDAMVGLLVTVFNVAWNVPQLFAGNIVARMPRKMPPLAISAAIGRPAILLFALYLFATNGEPLWLCLVLLFLALSIMFATDAFAALAWFDILGRAFPPEKRGGYLATWVNIKTIGIFGVSALIAYLLSDQGPPFPQNFAYLFLAGAVCLLISFMSLSRIYEPPIRDEEVATVNIAWRNFGRHLATIWRGDQRLREVNIARVLLVMGTMAAPFIVLYATQIRGLPLGMISLFISAQTVGGLIGSLVLGRIADRFGSLRVIQTAAMVVLLAPTLGLMLTFLPDLAPLILQAILLVIYFAVGFSENVIVLGFMNFVLDITPSGQRTIYMGVSNAISTFGVLGSLLAGWVLSISSYPVLFGIAMMFGLSALFLALRMPNSRIVSNPAVEESTATLVGG